MLSETERARLEDLNRDHHRRMADNVAMLAKQGVAERYENLDIASREALYKAMEGAAMRCEMKSERASIVLELGAGSGRDRPYLLDRFNRYVGIEVVREAADADDWGEAWEVHHMAVEDMPDEWAGRFQAIYSRHVMEHVVDVHQGLSAIKKVLAPNGVVGAVTPHVFPDPEPAHVTQLKVDEWIKAYEEHGLRVVYCPILSFSCSELHLVAIHQEWPWPPKN
jgi:SAM-dependent methyltransferase